MAEVDDAIAHANGCDVPNRRKSGLVPRPSATTGQWEELVAATDEYILRLTRLELESGDRHVRTIRKGAESVRAYAAERAQEEETADPA